MEFASLYSLLTSCCIEKQVYVRVTLELQLQAEIRKALYEGLSWKHQMAYWIVIAWIWSLNLRANKNRVLSLTKGRWLVYGETSSPFLLVAVHRSLQLNMCKGFTVESTFSLSCARKKTSFIRRMVKRRENKKENQLYCPLLEFLVWMHLFLLYTLQIGLLNFVSLCTFSPLSSSSLLTPWPSPRLQLHPPFALAFTCPRVNQQKFHSIVHFLSSR